MKTISLKLPPGLLAKLDRASKRKKRSKSELVRAALDRFLLEDSKVVNPRAVSALDLAGDLVGFAVGPADLSTNRKHLEGYGT